MKLCDECGPGPRAVARGNPEAHILLVGQAPGREEAHQGKPFVGPAGKVLDKALASVGLTEADVLITNPVFFWPRNPDDRTPTPDEVAHGRQHLDEIIEHMKPALIIPLGATAVKLFVDSPWGITKLSGQMQKNNVFPIIHPAAVLHNPAMTALWDQSWRNLIPVLQQIGARTVDEAPQEVPWGPEQPFVHLHNHSEYSKLDGHQTVDEMLREARRKGFRTIALTDHGTLAGWMAFYRGCEKYGVKPILGLEAYIAESRNAREYMHLVLLAKNLAGYQALIKAQSQANIEQTASKPVIPWDDLIQLRDNVIALTACTSGVFGKPTLRGETAKARQNVERLISLIGQGNVFLEVQPHPGWEPQRVVNVAAAELSPKMGVGMAATNDNHYVEPNGWETQDVMLALRDHVHLDMPDRNKYDIHDLYIKDVSSVMSGLVGSGLTDEQARKAVANALAIAALCNVKVPIGRNVLPKPRTPENVESNAFFKGLAWSGLEARRPEKVNDAAYRQRMEYELGLYESRGFVDYMLIVWELVNWAKSSGIATGPGRGSVSGSLVAFCLNVTDVDPIEHDVIMERFVSEVRTDMPDIDMDFQDNRREDVIKHLAEVYGSYNVVRLGTEIRSKGRLVLRDVARVLGIPKEEIDPVAGSVIYRSGGDARANYTIEDSFAQFEVAKKFDKKYPKVRKYAAGLEGRVRNYGTHASGIMVTPWPVTDWVPVERRGDFVCTAWTMEDAEYLGLLKLDVLGITGLNFVSTCLDLVEKRTGAKPDLGHLTLEDEATLQAFANRETVGVFQFGSLGLRRLCERLARAKNGKLTFSDLATLNTLHRPAMLNIGLHQEYVYRVAGSHQVAYEHPVMEKHLGSTFGIAMYQEQIMMICRELGGLSWEHVGLIRKIISKKQGVELFSKARDQFVAGAVANGCDREVATRIFNTISHAGCVSGDTQVRVPSANGSHDMYRTIHDLYQKRQNWRTRKRPLLMSMYDDGRLRPNEMIAAVYTGIQQTYRVKTKSGHTIHATKDHFFLTPDGMYPLSDLAPDSYVCVTDFKRPKRNYKKTGLGPGRHGLHGPVAPDPWSPTRRKKYWRQRLLAEIGCCERCGSKRYLVLHHENEDREDNRRRNLHLLCKACHQRQHRRSMRRYTVGYDSYFSPISSVTPHRLEPTYDIAMAQPPHDYVANGFIVHNSYAFNKAHAVGYSMLAYRQMWLKVHYPLEYHAALLMCETSEELKPEYIRSARRFGIKVVPPDINLSRADYGSDGEVIRCGLASIDGVGYAAAQAIVKGQPYDSFADLVVRVDRRLVHAKVIERLIKACTLKSLHPNTKALLESAKEIANEALRDGSALRGRQKTLDGSTAFVASLRDKLQMLVLNPEWSEQEEHVAMRSVLQFPGEEHPFVSYKPLLGMIDKANGLRSLSSVDFDKGEDNILVAGIVTRHNWKIEGLEGGAYRDVGEGSDLEGHKYVHLNIEDDTDFLMAHFDKAMYQRYKDVLERPDGYPIVCEGHVRPAMSKVYVANFVVLEEWAAKVRGGEPLTAFERRLVRHPMSELKGWSVNSTCRVSQVRNLWALGLKVKVLAAPIWVREGEKVWQVLLQDINDDGPANLAVLVWPDAARQFGDELKSGLPLFVEVMPMQENDRWCVSGRHGCRVEYARLEG